MYLPHAIAAGAKSAVDGTYGLDGLHDRGSRCPQRRCGPLLRHDASSPDSVNTPRWAAKCEGHVVVDSTNMPAVVVTCLSVASFIVVTHVGGRDVVSCTPLG